MPDDDSFQYTQASAIPFRFREGVPVYCMITARRGNKWGFPKGNLKAKQTVEIAAMAEAYQEAGLHGSIVDGLVGSYSYSKANIRHRVAVVLMLVKRCDDQWLEQDFRKRRWVTADEVCGLIKQKRRLRIFERAHERTKTVSLSLPASEPLSLDSQQSIL